MVLCCLLQSGCVGITVIMRWKLSDSVHVLTLKNCSFLWQLLWWQNRCMCSFVLIDIRKHINSNLKILKSKSTAADNVDSEVSNVEVQQFVVEPPNYDISVLFAINGLVLQWSEPIREYRHAFAFRSLCFGSLQRIPGLLKLKWALQRFQNSWVV